MDHPADIRPQSFSQPASMEAGVSRPLLTLLLSVLFGGVVVWQLRQAWAKDALWPWGLLLIVMFVAAGALRRLDLWLPGEPLLPRLAAAADPRRRALGALCMALAQLLMAWVVLRLVPDYRTMWPGTVLPWLLSMLLMLAGAWLLGAVGRASPRAATASTWWSDSPRSRRLEAAAFVLILLLAVFLRTWRFESIPPGIYVDETNAGLDALYILEGRSISPFGTGWYGTANGYIYYMAGLIKLFGAGWLSLKLVSLIPAILTVAAIYFLGRLMFGPAVGLGAMLLMAVSRWHLSMSRWGWNETAPPLFQILATFFLIRGLRDRRAFDYALGGLLMGLSIYTYLS
ncbi:MAG TPA: glycosyltransferase family 39 protein, partial [Anaerolineales bacterium]|nr:glycosyltransferase family 39 protein [Anaerolineales bacterium]